MSCSSCGSSNAGGRNDNNVEMGASSSSSVQTTPYMAISPSSTSFTDSYGSFGPYVSQADFTCPSVLGPALSSNYISLGTYCDFSDPSGMATEFSKVAAPTDRTRYACCSLAVVPPKSDQFYNFLDTPMKLNNLTKITIPEAPSAEEDTSSPSVGTSTGNVKKFRSNEAQKYIRGVVEDALAAATTVTKKSIESPGTNASTGLLDLIPKTGNSAPEKFENFYMKQLPIQPNNKWKENEFLLPINDWKHNIREICKQCTLIEDHMTHTKKRCNDCITKHFLYIEGLAEEAVTLDSTGEMTKDPTLHQLPDAFRKLASQWIQIQHSTIPEHEKHQHYIKIVQEIRAIRKYYQQEYFSIGLYDGITSTNPCTSGLCGNT